MSVPVVEQVSAVITVDGCVCVSGEHVSALTTVDGCIKHVNAPTPVELGVCVSVGTCQCSDHCGWVRLCLWCNTSMCMGVSVSLVAHITALITLDGWVCV